MFQHLFDKAAIPGGRAILVHARLRGVREQTGNEYRLLADNLLSCLLACRPTLLLIPAYTIYGFMAIRIFHLGHAHSEVGRFSEEMRRRGFPRTPDPMFSMLDVLGALPQGLNYQRTFGPNTLFEHLLGQEGIVINVDMPGFYATPVHHVEMQHDVPYRFKRVYDGHIQVGDEPWTKISYHTYVRKLDLYGSGSSPHYNYDRRDNYLRKQGVITESRSPAGYLAWAELPAFCSAIDQALTKDKWFLVDQPSP
jgi:aminoglycoside N3'-acetyltransferase